MKTSRYVFYVLFFIVICITLLFNMRFGNNFNSQIRLINDYHDRDIYSQRGSWLPEKKVPYLEVFSEYPQLATYFFGLPHIAKDVFSKFSLSIDYYTIFSLLMIFVLFFTINILMKLLKNEYLAFLLLLPATFYFTYNRYDILPSFFSVLSYYFLTKERFNISSCFLAIGVLLKWYLIIIFPIFLSYYYAVYKRVNYKMIFVFCITGVLGVVPTLVTGGIEGFLVPYKFHMARGYNKESTFYLIKALLNGVIKINIAKSPIYIVLFLTQFLAIPLALLSNIDSTEKALKWSAFSILVFLICAKFYSPQWILWIIPFLILLAQKRKDLIIIILFDLSTFIYFPILYDLDTIYRIKPLFFLIIVVKTAFLCYYAFVLLKDVIKDIDPSHSISKMFFCNLKYFIKE